MRLPTRVHFPFGYIVHIRQVTDAEIIAAVDGEGPEDMADGCWMVDTRTIYIRKSLPLRRRRYILSHELGHALWDWQHDCLDANAMRP